MSLNIKNPDTYKDATRLAQLTGESLTQAVWKAIKERLLRLSKKKKREGLSLKLEELLNRHQGVFKNVPLSEEVGDLLYDQNGLPK
jgi:antitoxin VapB